jgi:NAD-dependent deacetylase
LNSPEKNDIFLFNGVIGHSGNVLIMASKQIQLVVLTGAGISAESGLRTFRDSDGLWEGHRVEDVATPRAWKKDPSFVLGFYNQRRKDVLAAAPNAAHEGLAGLQRHFDVTIITQNIDDLHERSGSRQVLHLHGEVLKMRSEINPSAVYPVTTDMRLGDLAPDGSQLRPDVVWFEEPVPMITEAVAAVREADLFVVIGTSLAVYPAAGLLDFVPPSAPKFMVDRKIPFSSSSRGFSLIEQPATAGITELIKQLEKFR